jgi:hypothetical protein
MKSNISEMVLPNTKKTVFYQVKSELIDKNFIGLATLLGPRRVGKTTLLQQLCKECNGYYFSIEDLNCTANEIRDTNNIESKLVELLNSNYKLICIDEITQLPKVLYGRLSHYLKLVWNKAVLITGSIPSSVEEFAMRAGTKITFRITSLSYYEFISWKYNGDLTKLSQDTYREYLTFKQYHEIKDLTEYAKDVLDCSKNNFFRRESEEEELNQKIEKIFKNQQFEQLLDLICLSGQFKLSSKGRFEDLPDLDNLAIADEEMYVKFLNLKSKILQKENQINALERFLRDTGLGTDVYLYEYFTSPISSSKYESSDYNMKDVIIASQYMSFEFPCFGSAVFGYPTTESGNDLNHQCEVDIFNKLIKIFHFPGKFRDNNSDEIDFMSEELLVEVKNATLSHAKKHLLKYKAIAERTDVRNIILTCTDNILLKEYDEQFQVSTLKVNIIEFAYILGMLELDYNITRHNKDIIRKPLKVFYELLADLRSRRNGGQ